jgi:glycosyltransferase involved in cell wall biosynthesis
MEKVSATIIVLNEETNIRDCLESVRWADEIIVSDTGSTDKTVELCETFGARVYKDQWRGYGAQKNLCAERARNDWILNIDADERVSPELKAEISTVLENGPPERPRGTAGYYIPRKNFFGATWIRHCGWWPDYNLRLYRRSSGRFAEKLVHEAVQVDGTKGYLKNPLVHRTYEDVPDYLERMERYSTLAAKQMLLEGRRTRTLDILIRPAFTFFKMFVLKRGFLDGGVGLLLSMLYASYTKAKYIKLREMKKGT